MNAKKGTTKRKIRWKLFEMPLKTPRPFAAADITIIADALLTIIFIAASITNMIIIASKTI